MGLAIVGYYLKVVLVWTHHAQMTIKKTEIILSFVTNA